MSSPNETRPLRSSEAFAQTLNAQPERDPLTPRPPRSRARRIRARLRRGQRKVATKQTARD